MKNYVLLSILKFLTVIVLLLGLNFQTFAQTGPAGVGNTGGTSGQPANKIWFDAAALSYADLAAVSTWADKSGNATDAAQATASRQPQFRTGQLNGFPAVLFYNSGGGGNEDFLPFNGNVIAATDYTLVYVAAKRTAGAKWVMGGTTNSGANQNLHFGWQSDTQFKYHHWGNDFTGTNLNTTETGGTTVGTYGIFTLLCDDADAANDRYVFQNNAQIGQGATPTHLVSWNGAGMGGSPQVSSYSDINIAEVIAYSNALNAAQLQIVHQYLEVKYGITIANDLYTPDAAYKYETAGIGIKSSQKHSRASSSGFYISEDAGTLDTNGEFVFFSHNNATNSAVLTDLPAGVEERWARDWFVDKTGTTTADVKLIFDLPEGISGGQYPGTLADYVLLYRNSTSGTYTELSIAAASGDADQIQFSVSDANLADGYYTLGTKDKTASPVIGISGRTWYALISGNWDNWQVWTLDPAGMLPVNSGHEIPQIQDKVVIHSGKTVTVQAVSGAITVAGITLEGKLDLQNTLGHSFTTIRGSGKIMMSADNFPAGNASHFYTAGQGEGTVLYYGTGYSLSANREFFNVEVELTNSADILTLATDYQINGNFTVKKGKFQINDATNDVIRKLTVNGDVLVESAAQITVGTGNPILTKAYDIGTGNMPDDFAVDYHDIYHEFKIFGNFTNNGTIRLTNQAVPDYNDFTTTGAVSVYLMGSEDKSMILNGITDFYNLIINKGTDKTYVQTIVSANIANFNLYGANSCGRITAGGYSTANPLVRKALWIQNGTLKLTGALLIPTLSEGGNEGGNGDFAIGQNACLWIAGSGVSVYVTATDLAQVPAGVDWIETNGSVQALSVYGKFRISDGYFDTRNSAGFIFWNTTDAQVQIDGGIVHTAQLRSANGGGGVASYVQTGGEFYVEGNVVFPTASVDIGYPLFGFDDASGVFNMSGGELIIRDVCVTSVPAVTTVSNALYIPSAEGNYNVTGGKVIIETASGNTAEIGCTAPLWSLELKRLSGTGTSVTRLTKHLKVLNILTINANTQLDVQDDWDNSDKDLYIGSNFALENGGSYLAHSNTTYFIGDQQTQILVKNTTNAGELKFNNLTIQKNQRYTTTSFHGVIVNGYTRAATNHPIEILGDFNISRGEFDYNRWDIHLKGNLEIVDGQIIETDTPDGKLVLNGTALQTLKGATGKEQAFGNFELNNAAGAKLLSNINVTNFILTTGIMDLDIYNLDVQGAASTTGTYSTTLMYQTAGNSGDGGLSLYINGNGTYLFPIGTNANSSTRYTPASILISGYSDDGRLQINPSDEILSTTATPDNVLSYHWRTRHANFTTLPTVSYTFNYDESDLDGSINEALFVPGKVLDQTPYTRSSESDTEVDETLNTIVFNGSGSGFTLEKAAYTAGMPTRFVGTPNIFFTRNTGGYAGKFWTDVTAWSNVGFNGAAATTYPQAGDIVKIGYGGSPGANNHHYIIINSTVSCAEVEFVKNPNAGERNGRIAIVEGNTANLNRVYGEGEFNTFIRTAFTTTVNADFQEFAENTNSTYMYKSVDNATHIIPVGFPTVYPNLSVEMPGTFIFPYDVTVNGYFNTSGGCNLQFNDGAAGDFQINGDMKAGGYLTGKIFFPASGTARTVTVNGNIELGWIHVLNYPVNSDCEISVKTGGATNVVHTLKVGGNINIWGGNQATKDAVFDLFTDNTGGANVKLELFGDNDKTFYNATARVPQLYRLVMNKQEGKKFDFNYPFTLNGTTDSYPKALELISGDLSLKHSGINIYLTSGGANFRIPKEASLNAQKATLRASGISTGIWLDGAMTCGFNSQWLLNEGDNNYIEYSASGLSKIVVFQGDLYVGSQIRRATNTEEGILTFKVNHANNDIVIGTDNFIPENARGVFEILNAGSELYMIAGSQINIVNAQANPTFPTAYIAPETYSLEAGSYINFGNDANTRAAQTMGLYAGIPLCNINLNSVNSPTVKLWNVPLTLTESLSIETGATLNSQGHNITLAGHWTNNGTYTHGNNLVTFNGASAQNLGGTATTTFYQLTKNTANTVTLQNDITVLDDLTISGGTLADNSNDISLFGDIYNTGTHTYGGAGNGISFLNNNQQKIFGNNGVFGKLTCNNPDGVKLDVNTDEIFINNALQLQNGVFDIGENLLTLRINAQFIEQNSYSNLNMVQTNNSIGDFGVKKYFPAGAGSFLYPIGSAGKYTPLTVTVSQNSSAVGYLVVKAADEVHPTVQEDAETPDTEIVDTDNALQFYWTLEANGFTDGSGIVEMCHIAGDAETTAPYTTADYITARLLQNGSGNWNHYDWADYVEASNKLVFYFTNATDAEISGDYTAGAEPNSANRLGAIPNQVAKYISFTNGNWTNPMTWETYPVSAGQGVNVPSNGPRGAIVIVKNGHTVDIDQNYISSYTTEIQGTLRQGTTFGNRLGIIEGQGTLSTETSTLPAGYYPHFFAATGGTLEYTGTSDIDILGQISSLNNLKLSGTGRRNFPNLDVQMLGSLIISDNPTVINDFDKKIALKKDLTFDGGTYEAGTGATAIFEFNGTAVQTIDGSQTFTGANALYNLKMNNPAGIALSQPLDVDNELNLTSGMIITTSANILTLESISETVVTNSGTTSFVDGPLNKQIAAGGDFVFPTGDNARFGKAGLNDVSATDYYQMQYYNYNPKADGYDPEVLNTPLKLVSVNEYWRTSTTNGRTAKVMLRWDADNNGFADDAARSNLRIAEWQDLATDAWVQVDASNTISGTETAGTVSSTVSSTFNEFGGGSIFTIASVFNPRLFKWEGDISTAWETAGNWDRNAVPTALDDVEILIAIPNNPAISSSVICNELKVGAGRTLTINAANSLTANDVVLLNGTMILKSPANSNASASFIDNGLNAAGTGTIQVERFLTANEFHYVSSPIATGGNAASDLFTRSHSSGNFNPNFYTYNETMNLYGDNATAPAGAFDDQNLVPGWVQVTAGANVPMDKETGYAFYSTEDELITFIGKPYSGDLAIGPLTHTVNDPVPHNLPQFYDGWNLVANPYPSAIDWDLAKVGRSNIDDGIYVWDGTQYASYAAGVKGGSMNLSNKIAPMQAFFVHATATPASFTLQNSHRVHSSEAYMKSETAESFENFLRLSISANGYTDNTVVYFRDHATDAFDGTYDAFKLFGTTTGVPHVYSLTDDNMISLSINALHSGSMSEKIVPLGIRTTQSGAYTLNISEFTFEDVRVWLRDKSNGTEVYLNEQTSYTFTHTGGNDNSRFELIFRQNNAPTINSVISEVMFTEDSENMMSSENIFVENDRNDNISKYEMTLADGSALPEWLLFDAETQKLTGIPSNSEVGAYNLKFSALDTYKAEASQYFMLYVLNVNDAPMVLTQIADQEIDQFSIYEYQIPETAFTDIDADDMLTVRVENLPQWMRYDDENRTLNGIALESGKFELNIIATDIEGESVEQTFLLDVKNTVGNEQVQQLETGIYPNISTGIFTAQSDENIESIRVTDISSKQIFMKSGTGVALTFDLTNYPSGIYSVEIQTNTKKSIHRIVLRK